MAFQVVVHVCHFGRQDVYRQFPASVRVPALKRRCLAFLCYGRFLKSATHLGLHSCLSKRLQFIARLPSRATGVNLLCLGQTPKSISWCSCWPLPIAREGPFLCPASIPGFSVLFTCWVEGLGAMTSPLIQSAGGGTCLRRSRF